MIKINSGDRFGRLTVIKQVPRPENCHTEGRYYLCKCDCGNDKIVCAKHLRNGDTKSCGCLSRETASKNNSRDIPLGSRFGKLTVIKRAPIKGNAKAYWTCKCECGTIIDICGQDLLNGHTKSCGCLKRKNLIDEVGNTYGKLTVLTYSRSQNGGGAKWLCKCECGNIIEVEGESLRSGHTKSCGCIKSYAEEQISILLNKYNISYSKEFTFPDLISSKGGVLRFDFALFFENSLIGLIEYQGDQHFNKTNAWYSEDYIERDLLKYNYCKEHNIKLYIWDKNTDIEQSIINIKSERE